MGAVRGAPSYAPNRLSRPASLMHLWRWRRLRESRLGADAAVEHHSQRHGFASPGRRHLPH